MSNYIPGGIGNANEDGRANPVLRAVTESWKPRLSRISLAAIVIASPLFAQPASQSVMAFANASLAPADFSALAPRGADAFLTLAAARTALPAPIVSKRAPRAKTWWVISGVALTAASFADLGASLGHNEANPALRSSNGSFSFGKGISIKAGVTALTLVFQHVMARHHPELYAPSAAVNFAGAGVMGGIAAHNANTAR
jgi:hypothetical protein